MFLLYIYILCWSRDKLNSSTPATLTDVLSTEQATVQDHQLPAGNSAEEEHSSSLALFFILLILGKWRVLAERLRAPDLSSRPNFMALLTTEFCAYYHDSPLKCNFHATLVSVVCLVPWSTHAQKPKFVADPWNTLVVIKEFPATVSADSLLTVSRAMKLSSGVWSAECGFETRSWHLLCKFGG